jgi:hypothetical protein
MATPVSRTLQQLSNSQFENTQVQSRGNRTDGGGTMWHAPVPLKFGRRYLFLIFFILAGCSAHSPFILTNTTDSTPVQSTFPSSQDKVFITTQSLPRSVAYVSVSTIDVGKIWYGSTDGVLASLADRARQLGANAVIETKTWHQPAGFAWAAPEGSGLAVRVADIKALEASGVEGTWH